MKIDNPHFNWEAAERSYDAISKLDVDEAELLTRMIVFDVVNDEIVKNFVPLQKHLEEVVDAQLEDARKAIVLRYRREGASPELAKMAEAVQEISKADWDPKLHPRNKSGQFTFKVKTSENFKPFSTKQERRTGIPHKEKLSDKDKARYHQEYMQVSNLLQTAQQAGFEDPHLIVENNNTGDINIIPNPGTKPRTETWDPKNERVLGVRMQQHDLGAHGATFDLMTAMGHPFGGDALGAGIAGGSSYLPSFAEKWYTKDDRVSNSQLYNRVGAGSEMLGRIAPYSRSAQVASAYGKVVGEHGSDAEKVFGPPTRRAMYRYRGTERQIDVALKQKANREAYKVRENGEHAQATARKMVYYRYLADRLPKKELNRLQLESGVTPPSEGIMIDKNGNAVVQAVGYGDDHYLPFNLKHMAKHLKGGEYIRTRSVGGPTAEDVYAGWMAGANQVTVISRSGVFEVEFERDFKGGRRYNQKAHRMIHRYERLVDSLAHGNVERVPVTPEERRRLSEQVQRDSKGLLSPQMVNDEVNRLINERRASKDLTPKEWDEFEEEFTAFQQKQFPEGFKSEGERQHFRDQLYEQYESRRAQTWELNAQGYKAAMDALQEQFPYYIRDVRYVPNIPKEQPTDELQPIKEPSPGSRDTGLVEHTRNRPTQARGTFHSYTAGGAPHFTSAAEMDHQAGGRPASVEPPKPKEDKPLAVSGTPAAGGAAAGAEEVPEAVKDDFAQRALAVRNKILPQVSQDPNWNKVDFWNTQTLPDDAFVAAMKTPEGKKRFEDELGAQGHLFADDAEYVRLKDAMDEAGGKYGQETFDESKHLLTAGQFPYSFALNDEAADAVMKKISSYDTFSGKSIADMDDKDLRGELDKAFDYRKKLSNILTVGRDLPDAQRIIRHATQAADILGPAADNPVVKDVIRAGDVEPLDEYIRGLHLARNVKMRQGAVVPPKAGEPEELGKMTSSSSLLEEVNALMSHLAELPPLTSSDSTTPSRESRV